MIKKYVVQLKKKKKKKIKMTLEISKQKNWYATFFLP